MKRTLLLLLLPLLLTSCSNPGTSGGVTLSRGGDDGNEFPYGSCEGQGKNPPGGSTGCGWIHANEESYYIRPSAGLYYANLSGADLDGAILRGAGLGLADLSGADLTGADLFMADLSRADLWNARLRGADLRGALHLNSTFGADQARWYRTTCPDGSMNIGGQPCSEIF